MPNNYLVETNVEALAQQLGAHWQGRPADVPWPSHVFPKYQAPIVVGSDGRRLLRAMRFGFAPPFAKDQKSKPIHNARWETLAEKRTFRGPLQSMRCLIPLMGFFEYCEPPQAPKWFGWFAPKDGRLAVGAGLWTSWQPAGGAPVDLFTLITRDAPEDLLQIGLERMPVWLPPEKWDQWLDPAQHDIRTLHEILAQYDPLELAVEPKTPPSRAKKASPEKKSGNKDKKGKSNGDSANLSFDFAGDDE